MSPLARTGRAARQQQDTPYFQVHVGCSSRQALDCAVMTNLNMIKKTEMIPSTFSGQKEIEPEICDRYQEKLNIWKF